MWAVRTAAGIGLVERNARLPVPPRILERHRPDPARLKNTYIREGQILPHLTTLAILLADNGVPGYARQVNTHSPAEIADLIDQLHATGTVLAYEPDTRIIRAGNDTAVAITVGQHS
jgi:hypothetical protein